MLFLVPSGTAMQTCALCQWPPWTPSNEEEGTWPSFVELAQTGGLKQPAVKDWNWGLGVEKILGPHCKKPGLGAGIGN